MQVHVFKGKGNAYGFTGDRSGANLPSQGGPWAFQKTIDLKPGENRIGLDSDKALREINANGFYVGGAGIVIEEPGNRKR
ncbi:hypothetical protein ACVDG8_034200 [Mesorhizobium sp. ORM8.1]